MKKLSGNFNAFADDLVREIGSVEGFLSEIEMRFLSLLAAYPTVTGSVLEIGSFKGRSTIILARSAEFAGDRRIYAVDPMIAPSETDPDLRGSPSSLPDFEANLSRFGVETLVKFSQDYSFELAKSWNEPIRLLWIDGDHTYVGTKLDLEGFAGHLADGAIVAIHDVLHEFEGGVRVFAEDILLSPNFGACGFVGSIAWAQFCSNPQDTFGFRSLKLDLFKRLCRLIPFVSLGGKLSGLKKVRYKLLRSRIPHGAISPDNWTSIVADKTSQDKRGANKGKPI